MGIRIIAVPPGEALEEIRREWVGLVLPLAFGEFGPRRVELYGTQSGPPSLLRRLWLMLTFRRTYQDSYLVMVNDALDILEKKSPEAAAWWRTHAPHMLGKCFAFDADVCENA